MTDRLNVLLADPSLFTAPYDIELTEGLRANDVSATWAIRVARPTDEHTFRSGDIERFFYRGVDSNMLPPAVRSRMKGLSHVLGLLAVLRRLSTRPIDVLHLQWAVLPMLDWCAIRVAQKRVPVILTVHDTTPFNGDRFSRAQSAGFDKVVAAVDRVIVHTKSAAATLAARGHDMSRVRVIPHGPLPVALAPSPDAETQRDLRFTLTAFGQIKPYKGIGDLVEAVGRLDESRRRQLRVVVAGEPYMDIQPLLDRIRDLDLTNVFDLRLRRQSEQEMADLFAISDGFVFPYLQIDASGVYFMIKGLGRWIVASCVGVFAEDIEDGVTGRLFTPGDVEAFANALQETVDQRPAPCRAGHAPTSWPQIGLMTRSVYEDALLEARGRR